MAHSIRWRIAIPIVLLLVLTIAGLSQYLLDAIHQTYLESIKTTLLADAHLVSQDMLSLLSSPGHSQDINSLVRYYADTLDLRVTIIRADGVVLGESAVDSSSMENHMNRPEVQQALHNQEGFQIRYSTTLKKNMFYVASPVREGEHVLGIIRLARPLDAIEANLNRIRSIIFYATVLVAIIALLLAFIISEYTIRPIIRLTRAAQQLAVGNYDNIFLPSSQDEIGKLNDAFKQMAGQLQVQIGALKTERGKFASVLEQMLDGVVIVDAEGTIQLVNPTTERMFDIKRETALGQSLIKVLRNYHILDLWKKCLESGESQTTTLELNIEHLFLQVIATSLNQYLPGSTLLLFQDLTRQRKLETVRQDFISNVSHELRTPLASLKALTETLQEGALEDPPAARRFLSHMETEIDNLTQMVRELLELSRIESGKVPLSLQKLEPLTLLNTSVDRMRLQAERAGLTLRVEYPVLLPQVLGDPERLDQVLTNLLHNAIKFTPPGGEIIVSAQNKGKDVIFQVKDSGEGISSEDLPRIFERFYKADRARTGGGTGLGLSIAKHIIEAHGGRIWAESSLGEGSTFYFSLHSV